MPASVQQWKRADTETSPYRLLYCPLAPEAMGAVFLLRQRSAPKVPDFSLPSARQIGICQYPKFSCTRMTSNSPVIGFPHKTERPRQIRSGLLQS